MPKKNEENSKEYEDLKEELKQQLITNNNYNKVTIELLEKYIKFTEIEDKLNKEEDIDAAALIEEANSIMSKGAKATGNEQTGSTREDSSDRQADRGNTDTTKDKSDKEEADAPDKTHKRNISSAFLFSLYKNK